MTETLAYRVECLEKDTEVIKSDVKLIMRNHLPTIQSDVNGLKTLMKVYGSLIIAGVTALIILGLTP